MSFQDLQNSPIVTAKTVNIINSFLNSFKTMKQKLLNSIKLRAVMLVAMLCALSVGHAWATDVTFIAGTDVSNTTSITKDGITISVSSGTLSRTDNYRCYANNTMTISSTVGNITNITFTFSSSSYNGDWDTSYSPNSNTWTSSSASGQARITQIVVSYTPSGGTSTTYTVTYDANGGSGTMTDSNSPYNSGATVTVLGNSFTRDGYDFVNWNTAADGSGTDYDEDDTFTITANTTLYAQWTENSGSGTTYTYNFAGANNFYTDTNLTTHPGTSNSNNVGTIYYGDGSTFVASGASRYFSSASSGYFMLGKKDAQLSLPTFSGYKITQVKLHSSGSCSTNVAISIVSGSNVASAAQTWSNQNKDYTYDISSDYQSSALSVNVTNAYNSQITSITIVCEASNTVATPTINGTGEFLTSTDVSIECGTEGATIQYSTDGGSTWTTYSGAFTINATTTIKAKATKSGLTDSEVAEATFTKITPINVATALTTADDTEVYVQGIISRVTGLYSNSLTYFISDDGTESDELEIYNGKGLNGANFTNINDLQAGDVVVVKGTLTTYNTTVKELKAGSQIISLTTKADPELAFATSEYTVAPNASFATPELTNPHNVTVTYSVSTNDGVASINTSTGAVTIGANEGQVTVTATFAGDATYRAGSASYTIKVVDDTKGTSDNPYTVAEVLALSGTKNEVYVEGYIVGFVTGTSAFTSTIGESQNSNWALADSKNETSFSNVAPIQIQSGNQTTYGLTNHPDLVGAKVIVKGNIESYFSKQGVKSLTEISAKKELTLNGSGYATYACTNALDFSDDSEFSAWQITAANSSTGVISFTQIKESVAAGTGVLLKGTASTSINIPVKASGTDFSTTNKLTGITTPTDVAADTYYGLKANEFVKVNAGTVPAGKALLPAGEVSSGSGVKAFTFVFNGADGIQTVEHVSAEQAADIFNLAGQRLNKMQRGVNIVNGKKVLVK